MRSRSYLLYFYMVFLKLFSHVLRTVFNVVLNISKSLNTSNPLIWFPINSFKSSHKNILFLRIFCIISHIHGAVKLWHVVSPNCSLKKYANNIHLKMCYSTINKTLILLKYDNPNKSFSLHLQMLMLHGGLGRKKLLKVSVLTPMYCRYNYVLKTLYPKLSWMLVGKNRENVKGGTRNSVQN